MTTITEGITPAEFLSALNANFAYVPGCDVLDGLDIISAINSNYDSIVSVCPTMNNDDIVAGVSGASFISRLNSNFNNINNFGFVIEITTTEINQEITLPLINNPNCDGYNLSVDWGDESELGIITAYNDADAVHIYTSIGTYQIRITGLCEAFCLAIMDWGSPINDSMVSLITKVISWGNVRLKAVNFQGCTNLTEIPTDIYGAFSETIMMSYFLCLTGVVTLPSGLLDYCINVVSLTSAFGGTNNISNSSLISNIPDGLFDNCISCQSFTGIFLESAVTEIPVGLFDNCIAATAMGFIFKHCNITLIPPGLFDNNVNLTTVREAFFGMPVTSIPEHLFDNNPLITDFGYIFSELHITTVPAEIFKYNVNAVTMDGIFWRTRTLISIPESLFNTNVLIEQCRILCEECDLLASIPTNLFANNPLVNDLEKAFATCPALTGNAPQLWLSHAGADGTNCFLNDATLDNYADIPAEWK